MKKKTIGIDINSLLQLKTCGFLSGVGRTTFELVSYYNKVQNTLPFEIVLYSQNIRGFTSDSLGFTLKSKHLPLPANKERFKKLFSFLRVRELFLKTDLWHCPHNGDIAYNRISNVIFTIHDMIVLKSPGEFPDATVEIVKKELTPLIMKSKAIITCSESSKKDILEFFDLNPEKIHPIYWGIDHDKFKPVENEVDLRDGIRRKYKINNPYFFSVSCGYGRKNTIELLKAYNKFLDQNPCYDLVLIWKNYKSDVAELITKSKGRIHLLNNISDEELVHLYNAATITFYPSTYEGFGLPVVESMACGTPVVTCENSSLSEIGKDYVIYTGEGCIEIYETMVNINKGKYDLETLRKRGLDYAKEFTWEKCGKETLAVYEKYLS